MQKDYFSYTEVDFIADEYFQQWVKNPDAENKLFWEKVLADWPEKAGSIMAARSFIENLQFSTDFPSNKQTEASLENSLRKITFYENEEQKEETATPRKLNFLLPAIAVLFVGIIITAGYFLRDPDTVTIETVAGPSQIKTIILPDSSVVTLNTGAHLTYPSNLKHSTHREVWLEGEGFFHVKPLQKGSVTSRFTVHSGEMDIEVLGTTFNIKKAGSFTNVTLNSGKIKIGLKDDPQTAIYLQPGDFVQYSAQQKHIIKKQVKPELYSVWKEEKIRLDHMTLAEIARLLEDSYGYTIHIADEKLAKTEVSGTLVMKDEATLLQTLASALDIDIIKKDSVLKFQFKTKN
jgi:ferric-dicitrate binding protein FerR (iron transport regulator)